MLAPVTWFLTKIFLIFFFCCWASMLRSRLLNEISYAALQITTRYSASLFSTLLYSTVLYSNLLYCTVLYSILLYSTVLYSTQLIYTVSYSTIIHYIVYHCMCDTFLFSSLRYSPEIIFYFYLFIASLFCNLPLTLLSISIHCMCTLPLSSSLFIASSLYLSLPLYS